MDEDPDALLAELANLGELIPQAELAARAVEETKALRDRITAAKSAQSACGEVILEARNSGGTAIQTISPEVYQVLVESSQPTAA